MTINEVEIVDLDIHQNADVAFQVEWWGNPEGTVAVPLSAGAGVIKGGGEVHALLAFITVVGNKAIIFIPISAELRHQH